MAHFSDLSRMAQCLLHGITLAPTGTITGGDGTGGGNVDPSILYPDAFQVRRFGINDDGRILYDDFGEPEDLSAQINYKQFIQYGRIKAIHNKNDEILDNGGVATSRNSHIGGRTSPRSIIKFYIPLNTNVKENDVIIFPINTQESYRVRDIAYDSTAGRQIFTAIFESKISR